MKLGKPFKKKHKSSQTRQASGLLSTRTNLVSIQSEPISQQDTPLLATYHQTCKTLLYDTFIKIIVEENVAYLHISGQPELSKLEDAWQDILQEYSSLIKSEKGKNIFDAWKKCCYLEWQIKYIDAVVLKFQMQIPGTEIYLYQEEQANRIVELGYELIPDPRQGVAAYLESIKRLEMESKILIVMLNQANVDYKLLSPKQEEGQIKRTEGDYDTELAVLSKFMGTWLDKKTKTVSDVCAVINVYNQYIDEHKKLEKNG